jgi:hypothetical protein
MKTMLIPATAQFLGRGGVFEEYVQVAIDGHKRAIANLNMVNSTNFEQACRDWTAGNLQNRERGLPLTTKPIGQPEVTVRTVLAQTQAAPPAEGETTLLVTVAEGNGIAGTYLWDEAGPTPVCPDLPPLVAPAIPIPEPEHVKMVPADDPVPTGTIMTASDGAKWQKNRATTPFGTTAWWARIAALLMFAILLAPAARTQVRVACSPEPLAVMASLHVKTMGQWACFLRNDGSTPRTVAPEEVYMAIIAIKPLDPTSAGLVLTDRQSHSVASTVVKIVSIAGQLSGVALSLASRANAGLGTGLAIGSSFLQPVLSVAQGEVPSTAAYVANVLNSPVTLPPGGAATRMVFAARQKTPQPVSVTIV